MASGRSRAWFSNRSWARRSGNARRGPALISQLPGWVAAPAGAGRNRLAFHEKGVGGEYRAVSHRHAIVHEGANADRAAGADRHGAGLVRAVLLRIALQNALLIERALVADDGQGRLGDEDAVVEHPLAKPHPDQTPEHALEWRAVEQVQEVDRMQLPHALDPPEAGVVDGADGRRWGAERLEATLHEGVVDRGGDSAERQEHRCDRVSQYVVEALDRGQVDEHHQEDAKPPRREKNADRPEVESILGGKTAAQRFPGAKMIELAIALDGPRYLERWRAQQPHALVGLALDRDHDLGAEEAVVARLCARGIIDVVAHEVAGPDRRPGHAERGARDVVIEDVQTVGDHRAGADGREERVRGRHLAAEVRPRLHHRSEAPTHPSQEVDDVGAVTEQQREEPHPAQAPDDAIHRVAKTVQRVNSVRLENRAQRARHNADSEEAEEHEAEEEDKRDSQRPDHEAGLDAR